MSKHRYDRREKRHTEAVERQAARDSRTDEQQLRRLTTSPGRGEYGVAAKEVKRIVARQK